MQEFDERCVTAVDAIRKPSESLIISDEYCPHCDNHFVIDAKIPKPSLNVESEDIRLDARMLKDNRMRGQTKPFGFNAEDAADRLG